MPTFVSHVRGRVKKQFLFSPLAIPLESSISLYRCVADLAGNTSIEGGGGLKEGERERGNAAMLRFYDVSFIFRDNRSAQFPITLFILENSFSPSGLYLSKPCFPMVLLSYGRGNVFLVAGCRAKLL